MRVVVQRVAQQARERIRADGARRLLAIENLAGRDHDADAIAIEMQRARRAHGREIVPVRNAAKRVLLLVFADEPFHLILELAPRLEIGHQLLLERHGSEVAALLLGQRREVVRVVGDGAVVQAARLDDAGLVLRPQRS